MNQYYICWHMNQYCICWHKPTLQMWVWTYRTTWVVMRWALSRTPASCRWERAAACLRQTSSSTKCQVLSMPFTHAHNRHEHTYMLRVIDLGMSSYIRYLIKDFNLYLRDWYKWNLWSVNMQIIQLKLTYFYIEIVPYPSQRWRITLCCMAVARCNFHREMTLYWILFIAN